MEERRKSERGQGHNLRRRHGAALVAAASLLTSVSSAASVAAQSDATPHVYEETTFGRTEGLPSNSVYALERDDDGYLWVGTLGGLARFDGFDFDLMRSPDTGLLESNRVRSLLFDRTGTLWIGVDSGPLVRKRGNSYEAALPSEELTDVRDILEASDGSIWCAGTDLVRWRDGMAHFFRPNREKTGSRFNYVAESASGVVWAMGNRGLIRTHGDQIEVVDPRAFSGFFRDPFGRLWVALRSRKAYRLDDPARVEIDIPFAEVMSEIEIRPERMMLATDAGLMIIQPARKAGRRFVFTRIGERDKDVRCLLQDVQSAAWIGVDRFGLSHVRPRRFRSFELQDAAPRSAALEVHRLDARTALVGSMKREQTWIVSSDFESQVVVSADEAPLRVSAATVNRDGFAWVATSTGLGRLTGNVVSHVEDFERPANSIVRAQDDTVWVLQDGTYVEVLADGTPGRRIASIPRPILGAIPCSGGFLCIGGDSVVQVDTSTATASVVFHPSRSTTRAIAIDERGALWVTTYGSGLFRRKVNGQVDQWTTSDGLPDDFLGWVGVMTGADGRECVWLNSNRGLACVEITSFDRIDAGSERGLRSQLIESGESNGAAGAVLEDGLVLLPTLEGLVAVDQSQVKIERPAPCVVVEWVEVDGNRKAASPEPTGSADLAFGYTAILFPRSRDARFQYRLEGHDSDWVDAYRRRVAHYTNIPPGRYTFRVRARAAGGPWSESAATDVISVAPLWYQPRLNQGLIAVGFVALLSLAYVLRTRALTRRSHILAREIEQRQVVEEQLRSSEANYVSVLDSAHDGIVMIEADGTIGLANAAMCQMLGYTRDEILGRGASWLGLPARIDETSSPVDDESGVIALREIQKHGATLNLVMSRKDGTPLEVEFSAAEETFRGRPRLVGIVRDVSEHRRMTNRLRESEQRYRQLFRTAPTAIVAWRPDHRIVDWNERAAELFGWSRDATPRIDDLFSLDDADGLMRGAVEAVLGGKRRTALVHPTRLGTEDERRCRWTFAPLTGADGEVHMVISLVTDVTEDERIEHDMAALRRKLARAEETERSRIARELHDDLSQRLAALAIEMQLLENGIEQRPLEALRSAIHNVQGGLDEISTDVHALSRQLHPTVLDDLGLSRALRSECQRRRHGSRATIHFADESREVDVRNEVGLALFRIAQESIQNAIKHASAQEIIVRLGVIGGAIELTVRDDGVGFDAAGFENGSGGGLGLASVQERARLIGAELVLKTAPGEGTTISVTVMPRAEHRTPALQS